jgi:hypothetical protein
MTPDNLLIIKFLSNQSSSEEADLVVCFFSKRPEELEKHLPLENWLLDKGKQLPGHQSARMLSGIRQAYGYIQVTPMLKKLSWFAAAASVVAAIALGGLYFFKQTQPGNSKVSQVPPLLLPGQPQQMTIISNSSHHVQNKRLPDGSLAQLYPASTIKYLPDFEDKKRNVYLSGTGQFTVAKNVSRPFIVYEDGIATTALGTSFIVAQMNNAKVSVTLLEGRVKVWPIGAAGKQEVMLHPGDQITVSSNMFSSYVLTKSVVKENMNKPVVTENHLPGSNSELVFKRERLQQIFNKVAERFSVKIVCDSPGSVEQKLFTGKFLASDSLEFICRTISELHGLRYSIKGSLVTFTN